MLEFISAHLVFFIVVGLNILFSIVTISLYFVDKRKAIHNKWRIKEKTLLFFTYFFGAVGALIGIFILRHKNKHWYFVLSAIISLVIQMLLLYFIY